MRPIAIATILALSAVQSASGQTSWSVKQDLRIGSDTGMTSFSDVRAIAATKSGNIFVLDYKLQELRVFDPRGQFLRLAARTGQGPGEIGKANGLAVAPDGLVWINDSGNGRFSAYDADGKFVRQILESAWGYSYTWGAVINSQGLLVQPDGIVTKDNAFESKLLRRSFDGAQRDTLSFPTCPSKVQRAPPYEARNSSGQTVAFYGVPFQPRAVSALDHNGGMWCSPGDEYVVYRLGIERQDTLANVRSSVAPVAVTDAERKAAIAALDSFFVRYPATNRDYSLIPRVKPALASMFVDDADRLWVQRTPSSVSAPTEFDVWDSTGRRVATAKLDFRINASISPVVVGNSLYAVVVDQDDVPAVVRATIMSPRSP